METDATVLLRRTFGLTPAHLETTIGVALGSRQARRQGAFCDIYLQASSTEVLTWDEGILKNPSLQIIKGAGVRVVLGDRTGFSFTDSTNITELKKAAKTASTIANHCDDLQSLQVNQMTQRPQHDLYSMSVPLTSIALAEKLDLLRTVDKAARAFDSRITKVTVSLLISEETVIIANSLDTFVVDTRPMVRIDVECLAEQGTRRESARAGGGGRHDFSKLVQDESWRVYVDVAAKQALDLLSSEPAPAGEMTVVLGNGWPGVLIHEAVGHGLESDFNRKGTSAFASLMGEKVASDLCTVIDDGKKPGRRGSLNIDDEGTPTQETVLIEKGRLVGYMHDRLNGDLMGKALTGNGRRQDYRHVPMPRMTNTYLAGGSSTPAEIIASVEKGIYAVSFGGGQVDITNGNFTFSASAAYLIEHGKLTKMIKGATLIGNGPKSLKNISMVGNDRALDKGVGICGKEGQSVPVCVGMPTVRIDCVTVGGTK
jgi:TldD protein